MFQSKDRYRESQSYESTAKRRQKERFSLRAKHRDDHFKKRRKLLSKQFCNNEKRKTFQDLNAALKDKNLETRHTAIRTLRRCLCTPRWQAEGLLQTNIITTLLGFLAKDEEKTDEHVEAAWCLVNITAADCCSHVSACGGIEILLQLTQHEKDPQLIEACVNCLGNLAADTNDIRNRILQLHGLNILFHVFQTFNSFKEVIYIATWALSLFIQGVPKIPPAKASICLMLCKQLFSVDDDELWRHVLWVTTYLAPYINQLPLDEMKQLGLTPQIIDLIDYPRGDVSIPALEFTLNLLSSTEENDNLDRDTKDKLCDLSTYLFQCNILAKLGSVITSSNEASSMMTRRKLLMKAIRVVGNLCSLGKGQIKEVVASGIPDKILEISKQEIFEVQRECMIFIDQITAVGTNEHIRRLVGFGVLSFLIGILRLEESETSAFALDSLYAILQVGDIIGKKQGRRSSCYTRSLEEMGLVKLLLQMQSQENVTREIEDFAEIILDKYFN